MCKSYFFDEVRLSKTVRLSLKSSTFFRKYISRVSSSSVRCVVDSVHYWFTIVVIMAV